MAIVPTDDPVAAAATAAIHDGRVADLRALLTEHRWLATARLGEDGPGAMSRTLLHVATDWPGHFPQVGATIAALVEHGADVDARFRGPHEETPLHWAASTDDVEALDALLDAGADIDAPGAVLGGGGPVADARGFKQWAAAAGADLNRVPPWSDGTPLDASLEDGPHELGDWLRAQGARSAAEPG